MIFCYLVIFHFLQHWNSSGDRVHVFQMAPEVSALRKLFTADLTLVGSLHRVLAEVITQVAAFAEHRFTPVVAAPEVQLRALRFSIAHFDGLVPPWRYSGKDLHEGSVRD